MNNRDILIHNLAAICLPDVDPDVLKDSIRQVGDGPGAAVIDALLDGPFGQVDIDGCACEAWDGYTLALGQMIDVVTSRPFPTNAAEKATVIAEREAIVTSFQQRLDEVRANLDDADEPEPEADDLNAFQAALEDLLGVKLVRVEL